MKKTLLTLALVAASVAAFAQGKVGFGNDSAHLFVLGTVRQGDTAGPIPVSPLPSGSSLTVALYGGTSAGTLTLQKSLGMDALGWLTDGRMVNQNVTLTGIPGSATAYFQIVVSDVLNSTGPSVAPTAIYYGATSVFTAIPGGSITYPSLLPGGPSSSTWAAGNLVINAVPEPSTFALAGLGAAAMLIFRRRK